MTSRTLTTIFACSTLVAALAGCANNDRRAEEGYYTSASAANRFCPICGAEASTLYTAYDDGKEVDCCSQACVDKFNGASASEKRTFRNRTNSDAPVADTARFTPGADGSTIVTYNGQDYAQENQVCPVTGRRLDGPHYYVIVDGHRVDFANQSDAERYASMSYEQRTDMRRRTR